MIVPRAERRRGQAGSLGAQITALLVALALVGCTSAEPALPTATTGSPPSPAESSSAGATSMAQPTSVPLPDLVVVEPITWEPLGTGPCEPAWTNHLIVTVANRGDGSAAPFSVSLAREGATDGETQRVPGMPAHGTAVLIFDMTLGGDVTAVADTQGEVTETDEANNQLLAQLPELTATAEAPHATQWPRCTPGPRIVVKQ